MVKENEIWKSHITGKTYIIKKADKQFVSGKIMKETDKGLVEDKTTAFIAHYDNFLNYCQKIS